MSELEQLAAVVTTFNRRRGRKAHKSNSVRPLVAIGVVVVIATALVIWRLNTTAAEGVSPSDAVTKAAAFSLTQTLVATDGGGYRFRNVVVKPNGSGGVAGCYIVGEVVNEDHTDLGLGVFVMSFYGSDKRLIDTERFTVELKDGETKAFSVAAPTLVIGDVRSWEVGRGALVTKRGIDKVNADFAERDKQADDRLNEALRKYKEIRERQE